MSKKHKKVFVTLIYIENFLILASTITISISAVAYLVSIFVGNTSFAIGLKIYAMTPGIKNYQSIINKKRKKFDKIALLAKTKLKRSKVLFSKTLIDSNISQVKFFLLKNALKNMMI